MRSVLSQLQREERLLFVDEVKVAEPKTKLLTSLLADYANEKLYILIEEIDTTLLLASRNLRNIVLTTVNDMNVLSLIDSDKVIITANAHKRLEEMLG